MLEAENGTINNLTKNVNKHVLKIQLVEESTIRRKSKGCCNDTVNQIKTH